MPSLDALYDAKIAAAKQTAAPITPTPAPAPTSVAQSSAAAKAEAIAVKQEAALVAQVIATAVVNSPAVVNAPANTAPSTTSVQEVAQQVAAAVAPIVAPSLPPAAIQTVVQQTTQAVVTNPQVKAADVGQTVAPAVIQKIADTVVQTPAVANLEGQRYQAQVPTTPAPVPTTPYNPQYGNPLNLTATPTAVQTPIQYGTKQIYDRYGTLVTVYTEGPQAGRDINTGDVVIEGSGPTTPTGPTGPTTPTGPTGATQPVKTWTATDGTVFTDQNAFVKYQEIISSQNADKATAAAQLKIDEERKRSERQSAYDLLYTQFSKYGLGSLVEPLKGLITSGVSPSEFTIKLRETPEYQKRFSANAERIKKGLTALSEGDYLALEDQYQNIMRNYGLPETYWTRGDLGVQEGFTKLLANDVSASELENRILTAQDRVLKSNPQVLDTLKAFYGDAITNGDILAYSLDPKNALKDIQRKVTAAEIGGAAAAAGLSLGKTPEQIAASEARAQMLAGYGVTKEAAMSGFQTVAEVAPRGSQLAEFYNRPTYGQMQAEQEVFNLEGAAAARKRRKELAGLEQAQFSAKAGAAQGALGRERAGNL